MDEFADTFVPEEPRSQKDKRRTAWLRVPPIFLSIHPGTHYQPNAVAADGPAPNHHFNVVWILKYKADNYDLYEMIPGFFVGLVVIWIVSLLTYEDQGEQT